MRKIKVLSISTSPPRMDRSQSRSKIFKGLSYVHSFDPILGRWPLSKIQSHQRNFVAAGWRNLLNVATVDLMSKGFNWRGVVPNVDARFGLLFCVGLIRSEIVCHCSTIRIGWPKDWSVWQTASHCCRVWRPWLWLGGLPSSFPLALP